jgi:hypothetical protein
MAGKAKTETKGYTATAKVMGKTFTGKGKSVYEAIENIKPGGVSGMIIMAVTGDNNTKERVIPVIAGRRLFNTMGMTREVALKNTSLMFDGV